MVLRIPEQFTVALVVYNMVHDRGWRETVALRALDTQRVVAQVDPAVLVPPRGVTSVAGAWSVVGSSRWLNRIAEAFRPCSHIGSVPQVQLNYKTLHPPGGYFLEWPVLGIGVGYIERARRM